MTDTFLDRENRRQNNFGALRLILALAVLFSHNYAAYAGGHEHVEHFWILTRGQMDLGAFAVNAFFAISGYLITLSWMRTPQVKTFLMKRVLRIYPGFIIASLVSLLIVAPLSGAEWNVAFAPREIVKSIARIVLLSGPKAIGTFASEPIPVLNMSLWTIRYEFLCYLIVPVFAVGLGALKAARATITVLYALVLGWHASQGVYLAETDALDVPIIGSLDIWPRFLAYFLGGMVLAFNRDLLPFRHWLALVCLAVLVLTAIHGQFFIACATAGIYLIFYLAYQNTIDLHWIGEKVDLSYGVYLYAWPVQMLLIQNLRDQMGPTAILFFALPATLAVAALSWFLIEAPFLVKKAKLLRTAAGAARDVLATAPPAGPLALTPQSVRAAVDASSSTARPVSAASARAGSIGSNPSASGSAFPSRAS
jgi:peptidoglycan/LPS O-acetylase OafA/YrhL